MMVVCCKHSNFKGRPIMVDKQGEEDAVNERGDTIDVGAINKQCSSVSFPHTCLWRSNIVFV